MSAEFLTITITIHTYGRHVCVIESSESRGAELTVILPDKPQRLTPKEGGRTCRKEGNKPWVPKKEAILYMLCVHPSGYVLY